MSDFSERKRKAKAHVYATKGKGPCPYEPNTMEHKHWHRMRRHYLSMEAQFDDLAKAYGEFRPDRINTQTPSPTPCNDGE